VSQQVFYFDAVQGQDTLVRDTMSKGRNILGQHYPRDRTSEYFRLGTHCSGTHRQGVIKTTEKSLGLFQYIPKASILYLYIPPWLTQESEREKEREKEKRMRKIRERQIERQIMIFFDILTIVAAGCWGTWA
jgi:hypothetical protein